ncbi:MAG: WYL domain-containing protein [Deltaproteobacteria bacterium]|nr:WYL domain-containing protein [Deltaproteobacteria bacterium]
MAEGKSATDKTMGRKTAADRPGVKRPGGSNHTGTLEVLRNLWEMVNIIKQSRGISVSSLAQSIGKNPRTIRRYLDVLTEFGVVFETDRDGNIGNTLRMVLPRQNHADPLNLIALTRNELLYLYSMSVGLHHLGGANTRQQLFEKVSTAMGAERVKKSDLTGLFTGFEKGYKSYEGKKEILAGLLEGLYNTLGCAITYQAPSAEKGEPLTIEPYQMFEYNGGIYCYCYVRERDDIRTLAVERIAALTVGERFIRRPEVNSRIEEKRSNAFRIMDDGDFIPVRVRFSAKQAPYVMERVWHESEVKETAPDGRLTLTFTAKGKFEIIRWVLGWGAECEVLEPPDLRKDVAQTLKQAAGLY